MIDTQDGGLAAPYSNDTEGTEPQAIVAARAEVISVKGSIPSPRSMTEDFDDEIEEAIATAMAEKYPWTLRR